MRHRHIPLLTAALLACSAAAGYAQRSPATGVRTQMVSPAGATAPAASIVIESNGVILGHAHSMKSAGLPDAVVDMKGTAARGGHAGSRVTMHTVELDGLDQHAMTAFRQWAAAATNGSAAERDVKLTWLTGTGAPAVEYALHDVIVSKLSLGAMQAGDAQAGAGSVTLAAQSITTVAPAGH